ncbi:MAG: hypothetical protein LBC71_00705 [Oscillospiraceae bacterium]|nr:hypothetical protein [Oscillospiraceae bacterium]
MKKLIILKLIVLTMLTACNSVETNEVNDNQYSISVIYQDFDETLHSSTDIVMVNYIGHKPFGDNLIEYEFIVIDRILGSAESTIFVYIESNNVSVIKSGGNIDYNLAETMFDVGIDYVIVLKRLQGAMLKTHEDGYLLINNLIINMDTPSLSTMYNEPLSRHSTRLNFASANISENQITQYIKNETVNNIQMEQPIRSDNIVEIIGKSPYIVIINIEEPRRLVNQQVTKDWMETDIYFVSIERVLKGIIDNAIDIEVSVIFLADMVKTGEQYIVAVDRIEESSNTFELTTKNSLFDIRQLDEILTLLLN